MNSNFDSSPACVILSLGKRYEKLSTVASKSFAVHNPGVDLWMVDENNIKNYKASKYMNSISVGVLKYQIAYEIMKEKKYKKMIVIGSDTITCSRLDEFLDDNTNDILATLDYPYRLVTPRISSPDSETHLNADVVCFNNKEALLDIVKVSTLHTIYHEQGGLNEIVWGSEKYNTKIVDYPYDKSKVVYNARSKGNICATPGTKPWKEYVQQFYVKNEKLYTYDSKQIKIFHYCEGLGTLNDNKFNELINWWIFDCFNQQTKDFFKQKCNAGDFFERKFEQ